MEKNALVENELETEGQVVAALSRARIPVTAVDWAWVPQFESSRLVVVTSLYDTKGPRETYLRIIEALSDAGVYKKVREIVARSPQDPLARELVQQLKVMTEGAIHISKAVDNGRTKYSITFAPYLGKGGAIPSVRLADDSALRSFLERRLRILPYMTDQALAQLAQRGNALIPRVQLTMRQAKKLKLAA
jgi:hypothetical protein